MFDGNRTVLLHDAARKTWRSFSRPRATLVARSLPEVLPTLETAEELVGRGGCWAAGFVAYEAAPAFDPAFCVKGDSEFPLVWFEVFDTTMEVSGPATVEQEFPRPSAGGVDGGWRFPVGPEEYCATVDRIKGYIRSGETYQVNYTLRLETAAMEDREALFAAMVAPPPPPYAAWMDIGRFCICSASPELFFRLDGQELLCRPMKGTAPRGLWAAQDREHRNKKLLSEKNRAENVMIVDMVRNDMGRIAIPGTVAVEALYQQEKYPTLWQLTSSVRCRTAVSIAEIFRALFPAASITGAPKVRTMEIIAQLESEPRRVYTGAIGFFGPGRQAQFNVAIRTVLIDKQACRAQYGVGGGIVWDSVPARELEECRVKARILAPPLPHFELLETLLWSPAGGGAFVEEHLGRLADSADYFSFPMQPEEVRERFNEWTGGLPPVPHRVRLLLSREGRVRLDAAPLEPLPRPYRLGLAGRPVDSQDVFLYHKTTNRRVYEEALAERGDCDDVLLWNERGELTESTVGNLVAEIEGELVTPALECGLLPGVYRAAMLNQQKVRESVLRREEMTRWTKAFLVNSVRGMWEVVIDCGLGASVESRGTSQ